MGYEELVSYMEENSVRVECPDLESRQEIADALHTLNPTADTRLFDDYYSPDDWPYGGVLSGSWCLFSSAFGKAITVEQFMELTLEAECEIDQVPPLEDVL